MCSTEIYLKICYSFFSFCHLSLFLSNLFFYFTLCDDNETVAAAVDDLSTTSKISRDENTDVNVISLEIFVRAREW